jgi:alcohol dehydrogenase
MAQQEAGMHQLMYMGKRKRRLEWREVAEPVLSQPTDALVRPLAAARCDGDRLFLSHSVTCLLRLGMALHQVDRASADLFGPAPFQAPFAVGHECVAEVVALGEAVRAVAVGDVVVVPWAISCGACASCAAGLTSRCLAAGPTLASAYGFGAAGGAWGGMLSERVRVPNADHLLVAVPDGVDPVSLASASDNIPDGWRAVAPALRQRPGAPVLVVGGAARSIGLYAAGIEVALGAERVDYLDHDRERLHIAEVLGARAVELPARRHAWYDAHAPRRGGEYPISVDASSNAAGLRFALRSLAPGGRCTSVGYHLRAGTRLPLMQMYANCSTLHVGMAHARADLPDVLNLVASGAFSPALVTTHLADWADADDAFLEDTTKVVVHRPRAFAPPRSRSSPTPPPGG